MEETIAIPESVTAGLARNVDAKFQSSKQARHAREEIWLNSLRNFNGEYGPGFEFRKNGSKVFVNITQMKTMAAHTRYMALMFGPGGFPWSLGPTPHPELAKSGLALDKALESPEISEEMKEVLFIAKSAADGMRNKIKDTLSECHWKESFSRGALEMCVLGTMVFKGPVAAKKGPSKWALKEETLMDKAKAMMGFTPKRKYELVPDTENEYRATISKVDLFSLYPDESATTMEDAMHYIERHVMNKAQLVSLAEDGFDASEIQHLLTESPDGNWVAEPWENSVNTTDEAQSLPSNRYTVLEFWGYISGRELREAGKVVAESDLHKMHLAEIWKCGERCIKVNVSNRATGELPYYVVPYEAVPYSLYGRGIPEKMDSPQAIINAASRALIENMGMASGPQVAVDTSKLADGFDYTEITPWGVVPLKNTEGSQHFPIQFINVPSIIQDLERVISIFRNFVQEVTSIPDMASGMVGNGEHNRTMGGMSMLFGAADSYTRGVVANTDNYLTQPMIRALYDWEMQYCPDASIKGDMRIEAGGVQGLMAKELASQRNAETVKALAQVDGGMDFIDMPKFLKDLFRSNEVMHEDFIKTQPQVDRERAERRQMELEMAGQKAEAENVQPRPKAETTRNDMLLQALGKTAEESLMHPVLLGKLLDGYGELDEQAAAALNITKDKNLQAVQKFANEQELALLTKDLEIADKIQPTLPEDAPPSPPAVESPPLPQPPAPIVIQAPARPRKYKFSPPGEDGSITAEAED